MFSYLISSKKKKRGKGLNLESSLLTEDKMCCSLPPFVWHLIWYFIYFLVLLSSVCFTTQHSKSAHHKKLTTKLTLFIIYHFKPKEKVWHKFDFSRNSLLVFCWYWCCSSVWWESFPLYEAEQCQDCPSKPRRAATLLNSQVQHLGLQNKPCVILVPTSWSKSQPWCWI